MNLITSVLNALGSGVSAYILASKLRDSQSRASVLTGFQIAELGAVPFLNKLAVTACPKIDCPRRR